MAEAVNARRKPVHVEMRGGKSLRQRIWEAIRAQRGGFTCHSLHLAAGVQYQTTFMFLAALRKAGYVGYLDDYDPETNARHMALLKDNGVEAPSLKADGSPSSQGLRREAMWRTLRILGETSIAEVAQLASAAVPTTNESAKNYLKWLARAGYLKVSNGHGRSLRYRLIPSRYSGPRAPVITRDKQVYDANLDKVVWRKTQEAHA